MEIKYYTPTIDEFCVGFEYEYFNEFSNKYEIEIVSVEDIVDNPLFESIELNRKQYSLLRVKYLDKEDIESLGFTFIPVGNKLQNGDIYKTNLYEYGMYSTGDSYTILINLPNNEYWHISSNVNWVGDPSNMSTIFIGNIKNKSELKKLLKQLGINGQGN
jgi:hypothetical protein